MNRAGPLLLAVLAAGCGAPPQVASPAAATKSAPEFDWPVPTGWKSETIPFPLEFAPGLPFHGQEELRFAPGFFKPDAEAYWSYAFVWCLEDPPPFDAGSISAVLRDYFSGLALAVGEGRFKFDPDRFRVELAPKVEGGREVLVGRIESYDPFTTGEPIVLNVEVGRRNCPGAAHEALAFLVSPKSAGDPVWSQLRACASDMRCR